MILSLKFIIRNVSLFNTLGCIRRAFVRLRRTISFIVFSNIIKCICSSALCRHLEERNYSSNFRLRAPTTIYCQFTNTNRAIYRSWNTKMLSIVHKGDPIGPILLKHFRAVQTGCDAFCERHMVRLLVANGWNNARFCSNTLELGWKVWVIRKIKEGAEKG